MAGRKSRTKNDKKWKNHEVTDFKSEDLMYITDYDSSQYGTSKQMKNDSFTSGNTYGSKRYESYDSGDSRALDSYTYDDRDTSIISYEGRDRKYSPSEESQIPYTNKGRQSRRRYSPYEHSSEISNYFIEEEIINRKNTKQSHSPGRNTHNKTRYSNKIDKNTNGKKRRRNDFFDELEEVDSYIYSKPKRNKENSLQYQEEYEESKDTIGRNNRLGTLGRDKGFQVYAYQEPKQHDMFKSKRESKDGTFSPELGSKTNEYPVLVFKDLPTNKKSSRKNSDTVYLPVLVVGAKKTNSPIISNNMSLQNNPNEIGSPKKQGGLLVYAANLNNQKNIFQANAEISAQKTSAEQNYQTIHNSSKRVSQAEGKITSGINYTGSLPYSLFSSPLYTRPVKEDLSGTLAKEIDTMKGNRDIVNYQVNVDVEKDNQSIFGGKKSKSKTGKWKLGKLKPGKSKLGKSNVMEELEYKQIVDDPLHDNFPVTKDYIKVSDSIPGENQTSTSGNKVVSRIGNSTLSKSVDTKRTSHVSKISTVKPGLREESFYSQVLPNEERISIPSKSKPSGLFEDSGNDTESGVGKEQQDKRKSRATSEYRKSLVNTPVLEESSVAGEAQSATSGKKSASKMRTSAISKSVDMDNINRMSHVSKISTAKPSVQDQSIYSQVLPNEERISIPGKSKPSGLFGDSGNDTESGVGKEQQDKRKSRATSEYRRSLVNTPDLEGTSVAGEAQSATSGKKSVSKIGTSAISKSVDKDKINRTSHVSKLSTAKPDQQEESIYRQVLPNEEKNSIPGKSKSSGLFRELGNDTESAVGKEQQEKRKSRATTEYRKSLVNTPVLEGASVAEENQFSTSGKKSASMIGNGSISKSFEMSKTNRTSYVSKSSTAKPVLKEESIYSLVSPKEEQISNPIKMPTNELQSGTSLQPPSMKGVTTTILNISRVQPPAKPYNVDKPQNSYNVRESSKLKSKGAPDMNSIFVNSIEPTSALDKNEIIQTGSQANISQAPQPNRQLSRLSAVQSRVPENPKRHQSNLLSNESYLRSSAVRENPKQYQSKLLSNESNLRSSAVQENPKLYQSKLLSNESNLRSSAAQENSEHYQSKMLSNGPNMRSSAAQGNSIRYSQVSNKSKLSVGPRIKSILSRSKVKERSINKEGKKGVWSILRKNKSEDPKKESLTLQNEDPTPYYVPTAEMQPVEGSDDKTEVQEKLHDRQLAQEQSCDCVSKYAIYLREGAHFFLGSTLHEEIMNILKII